MTKRLPRATRRPERAAANSSGRCSRAAAGKVARDIPCLAFWWAYAAQARTGESDGQALAALGAASVDHGATTTGFHAHTETMGTFAASNGRLVGTFHDGLARSKSDRQSIKKKKSGADTGIHSWILLDISGFIPESPPFHQKICVSSNS